MVPIFCDSGLRPFVETPAQIAALLWFLISLPFSLSSCYNEEGRQEG